jgi:hypothetical protein
MPAIPNWGWARAELLVDVVFGCLEQSIRRGEKIEVRATRPNYPYTQTLRNPHGFTDDPSS